MSTKVVIIEDEAPAATKLERTLSKLSERIEVISKLESVEMAVAWFKENNADLIFCDIHLGDSKSFEIFEQVKVKTPIVFTTAYDQYAVQAFEVNSIDYLLKPVRLEDLERAFEKYQDRKQNAGAVPINELLSALQAQPKTHQERFMVQFGEEIRTVNADKVAYFFAEGKYAYLITHDDHEYLVDLTLDQLMEKLDPSLFFKISRQFIVSLRSIAKMYSFPKGRVKVILNPKGKKEAIVSIEKSPQFKKWLNR